MSIPGPISRPASALVAPTVLERAFEDPGPVLELLDKGAPYRTLAAVHREPASTPAAPWFRNFWALGGKVLFPGADDVFHNPRYTERAKELFGAQVVSPLAMMTNLNAPGPDSPPHLDLPFFRGAHQREVPSWMLAPMGYSGLFHHWAIPVASVITWFYDGPGGEFEYWPDGFDQPSLRVSELAANQAVMADNEYTYHRVCQVGAAEDFRPHNRVPYSATLELDDDQWVIRDEGVDLARYQRGEIRMSVLWKAYCFADQAQADAFTSGADSLTPAQIVDLFQADLRHRGKSIDPPENLDGEDAWSHAIRETYGVTGY
ncbi:MAG: hypothetical protein GY713_21760 [Actinomycetia bacterium]|nr:hypothetical protein [Actinomycetes bacterium]